MVNHGQIMSSHLCGFILIISKPFNQKYGYQALISMIECRLLANGKWSKIINNGKLARCSV